MKTVEAHGHFITSMAWGRATTGGGTKVNGTDGTVNGKVGEEEKRINVVATGSIDQTVKIWTP